MSQYYDEEQQNQTMNPPAQTWSQYLQANKTTIIIILLIAIVAIWYFYFRKEGSSASVGTSNRGTTLSDVADAVNKNAKDLAAASQVKIIRMRGGSAY